MPGTDDGPGTADSLVKHKLLHAVCCHSLLIDCAHSIATDRFRSQGPGEGATEFVLGSHKVNLSAKGLTTVEAVAAWAEKQPKLEATAKAGSVVLFSGYVLHRGYAPSVYTANCIIIAPKFDLSYRFSRALPQIAPAARSDFQ